MKRSPLSHLAISIVLVPVVGAAADGASGEATAAAAGRVAPAQDRFDVWEYRVAGNTVLTPVAIEEAVYPFLGPQRSLADVETARAALEAAYRGAGYGTVFVDIPEQSTADGVVRLVATEGRLDRVRIKGARYYSNQQIRDSLPALASGSVPNLNAVQTELAALNARSADRTVVPVMRSGRAPGTVDVELKVEDHAPLHASIEVNDRYGADTTHTRVTGSLSYDNLFQRQQSLGLQYQTAPEKPSDVQAWVATYAVRPEGWQDSSLVLYAVDSSTDVAALGTLAVLGDGQIYGARWVRLLPATERLTHNFTAGVDYKDFLENVRVDAETEVVTPINYFNWSLAYGGQVRRVSSSVNFGLTANLGLRGFGNDSIEFAGKRYLGEPNYWTLRGTAGYARQFGERWQVAARASGQVASGPLVSNEQFAIGGADTVRGYTEAATLGDNGLMAGVEVRVLSPAGWLGVPAGGAYVLAFADSGVVGTLDPLPGQDSRTVISSLGVGARVIGWHGVDAALDWAYALDSLGEVGSGESRTLFSVRYSF